MHGFSGRTPHIPGRHQRRVRTRRKHPVSPIGRIRQARQFTC